MAAQRCETCPDTKHLFCEVCGKVIDRDALKRVRIDGFIGRFSTSPKVSAFLETGDPAHLD